MPPPIYPSPPTLTSLPTEISSLIIDNLDKSSALSLARISPSFNELCQPLIWEHINLFNCVTVGKGLGSRAKRAVHGDAEKCSSIIRAGREERWKWVRGITVAANSDSLDGIIDILSQTSPTLESLHIRASEDSLPDREPVDWLEVRIHLSDISSFPSLTHLVLDDQSIGYMETLVVLCELAPNLIHLETSVNNYYHPRRESEDSDVAFSSDEVGTLSCVFPHRFARNTIIRQLHIRFEHYTADQSEVVTDSYDIIVDLITHSPVVEHFSLIYDLRLPGHLASTLSAVRALPTLQDLAWPAPSLAWQHTDRSASFANLRRLVLAYTDWYNLLPGAYATVIPTLDTLCFSYERDEDDGYPIIPHSASVGEAIPEFAAWLRHHPLLHHLHFFEHNNSPNVFSSLDPANYTGNVRSIQHHGDEELIAVSLLFRHAIPDDSPFRNSPPDTHFLHIVSEDKLVPWDGFGRLQEDKSRGPTWLVFTDLDGVEVPQEVLHEMLEAGGISEAAWGGRGVEVSEAAWNVVSDWRKKLGA